MRGVVNEGFYCSIPCIFYLYIMLSKVVSHYDLRVLSIMSVMPLKKKIGWGEWVGGVSSIHFLWDFRIFFNFAMQSP